MPAGMVGRATEGHIKHDRSSPARVPVLFVAGPKGQTHPSREAGSASSCVPLTPPPRRLDATRLTLPWYEVPSPFLWKP